MAQYKLFRKVSKNINSFILKKFNVRIINYRNNNFRNDSELLELLIKIRKEGKSLQSLEELYNIYNLSKKTSHLDGDMAEVGVYKGGSAKLIAINKGKRALHLFDSFKGILRISNQDIHKVKDFQNTTLEEVREYLSKFNNIFFYKGWFPDTAKSIENKKFSFVHLDLDLYQSTLDALQFFLYRMNSGGVILSHDYNSISCPGVSKAFNEFFSNKRETVIELAGTSQCLVVKL